MGYALKNRGHMKITSTDYWLLSTLILTLATGLKFGMIAAIFCSGGMLGVLAIGRSLRDRWE